MKKGAFNIKNYYRYLLPSLIERGAISETWFSINSLTHSGLVLE